MSEIKILKHSVKAEKKELFCLIGEYFASALVHKELGEAMVSDEQYTWLIALEGDSVQGFSAVKVAKNSGEFSYWWVLPKYRNTGVAIDLFNASMKYFESLEVSKVESTIRQSGLKMFQREGFEEVSNRGKWIRVRKVLNGV